jgi:acetoacetyl-CoA synthetase
MVEGRRELLWEPDAEAVREANLTHYLGWLAAERGLSLSDYGSLWQWSVQELEAFWRSIWDYYGVRSSTPYEAVLAEERMPGARWFTGARLNYAENVMARASVERPAILAVSERSREPMAISWAELEGAVGAIAAALRAAGVGAGDRVAAYLGNLPEAVIAMLATTSLGAVWTVCAPDFGTESVLQRFGQVEPSALIAVDGYRFGGREHDRRQAVAQLKAELPTVRATILIRSLQPDRPRRRGWGLSASTG